MTGIILYLVTVLWYSIESLQAKNDGITARATAGSDSPWFAGHFPDDPILPGIAQLKMVADLITRFREDETGPKGLSRVKFRKIVRPGEVLDIQAEQSNIENQYAFRITRDNEDICSGMMFF